MRAALLALVLATGACSHARPVPPFPEDRPLPSHVVTRLLLIGDAGAPNPGDPVLDAMGKDAATAPDRTTVLFLGDNIYPRGLPDSISPDRAEAERRIRTQINTVRDAGAKAIFIPGNHDWAKHGLDGWNAVRRVEQLIEREGAPRIVQLPDRGCPGPSVKDLPGVRLILLDTQWWLHGNAKPSDATSGCPSYTEEGVVEALRVAVDEAGDRHVVVAAHHPLASGGEHGGHFAWTRHIFPLRAVKKWAWLPLPILGSAYPVARASGVSSQDLSGGANERMRAKLAGAMAGQPPLIWVSGHEHNLQVFQGTTARNLLVSGSGYYGHGGFVQWSDSTRYASDASGYMRVEVLNDGRVWLSVIEVSERGATREAYAAWLQ